MTEDVAAPRDATAGAAIERFRLDGRTVLVTGASRGIGRAAAIACASAGASVVLASRSAADLEETAAAASQAGAPAAVVVPTDVLDEAAVDAMVARAVDATGRLDVLVNVAGGQSWTAPVERTRTAGFEKVLDLNVRAVFLACRAALPVLPAGGAIVNIGSVAGARGEPGLAAYCAAKAAVVGLTRTLAMEVAARGIRVNCLAPGWFRTHLTRDLWEDEAKSRATVAEVPMGRWGEVDELAGAVLLLASDAGSYLTGATLVVDGGLLA